MPTKTSARRPSGGSKRASGRRSARAGQSAQSRRSRGTTRSSTKRSGAKGSAAKGSAAKRGAAKRPAATRAAAGRPTPERPSKGISRIDQPSRRTHGFFVRLDYRKTPDGYRPRLVAFFGDASHGGKRGAWKAAEEWADRNRRGVKRGGTAKRRSV